MWDRPRCRLLARLSNGHAWAGWMCPHTLPCMEQGNTNKAMSQLRRGTPSDGQTPQAGSAAREAFAIVLLLLGGFLFWLVPGLSWISWLGGLVLLFLSQRWSVGDKLIGAVGVAVASPVLSGSILFAAGIESCIGDPEVPPGTDARPRSGLECATSGMTSDPLTVYLMIGLLAVLIFAVVRLTKRARQI